MGDGVRLAVSLFLPEAVEGGEAAPVLLEALPYRKDDVTASYRAEYERGDGDAFEVRLDLEAREGDELRWTRSWRRRIPRHLA